MKLPGLPPQASAHAPAIDFVLGLEHWGMLALFALFLAYLSYVLIRFRSSANVDASYTGMRSYWSVYVVLVIVFAEGVLLVAYEMPEWRERLRMPAADKATVVRVVAEQYQWNIHYPGPDGTFGPTEIALISPDNPLGLDRRDAAAADDITTINQLTVPVSHPVLIRLTSKDVIHSFGVNAMRVKQDAMPGAEAPLWFVPTTTTMDMRQRLGRPDYHYEIACSQLCGLGHYRMRGFVNVVTDDEYQAFIAEEERALGR